MADYFEPVTFSWTANEEEDLSSYRLKRSSISGSSYKTVATIAAGTEQHTITDLRNGTWYFVLTAVDSSGNESDASDEVEVTLTEGDYDTTAPSKPTGLHRVT